MGIYLLEDLCRHTVIRRDLRGYEPSFHLFWGFEESPIFSLLLIEKIFWVRFADLVSFIKLGEKKTRRGRIIFQ